MSLILNIITTNSFIPNCLRKMLKMVWNCNIALNGLKIGKMGSKRYMMLRIWREKMLKMVQKFLKWHETGKNGVRQLKWMKIVQDCTKWFKSGPNWSKKDQKNLSCRVCFAAKNISSIILWHIWPNFIVLLCQSSISISESESLISYFLPPLW